MTMRPTFACTAALAILLAIPSPTLASTQSNTNATASDPTLDPVLMSGGFLSAHPDMRFRMHGMDQYKRGDHAEAFRFFRRAGYYGDKPSQAMVAEMLWDGLGVEQDRAQAYAWMDLAAERGYELFVLGRERYWVALDESARQRALEVGQEIYAKYGDAAAEPRLATILRRERARQTGSRTGFTGTLQIIVPGPGGVPLQIDGSKYYDDRYWEPEQYRAWQDSVWMKPKIARVDVGSVEQVEGDQPASRIPSTTPLTDVEEPQTLEPDDTDLEPDPS